MSNKINKDEVRRIARLSNIGLDESEVDKLQSEMESILDYVGVLEKVNTANVEPTSYTVHLENIVREDGEELGPAKKDLQNIDQSKFLDQAPEKREDFFKTHSVFASKK
ncbi:MAG: Aspartyl/glutamyl-tRNA(Asn/Gln) amidotransferase subunit C [Parcubacteria group bacterium GW2011_GWA2_39_18]|nr:MAG: Aspartyl/glutamyl-tRNA(Asn/Gln) amidotransferase subunit C [Parcubacteria group bacterium GW2011_GWA2_39_18]